MSAARPEPATESADLGDLRAPFRWRRKGGLTWIEARLPGAVSGFSTRLGGSSDGPYRSLNLGILTDDDPALVARNRESLASALGRDAGGFAIGFQVHGAEVQVHTRPPVESAYARRGTALARADAQVTAHAGVTPLVLAADCVPLVLAAPGAVAAVHCGWRGAAAGVVARAVSALGAEATVSAARIGAALGPAIGPCCYEVGARVVEVFRARGLPEAILERRGGMNLDLGLAVRLELERAGVDPASIGEAGLCTSCRPDLFFSHRGDRGVTGRQAGIGWIEP